VDQRIVKSWTQVGERVALARTAAHLTQEQLAEALGLDRTAIAKVETGRRTVNSLELASLARVLGRSVEWFVSFPPPSVLSRRAERLEEYHEAAVDALIETLARDVELLIELEALHTPDWERPGLPISSPEDAERAARTARELMNQPFGAITDLARAAELLGLYAFSERLSNQGLDGVYVALETGGVALINGAVPSGRRRFTLAHELGHHFMDDEYATDWAIGENNRDRERLINAFASSLLMPRESVTTRWQEVNGSEHPRDALIRIAVEYRVSWSAAASRAANIGLIDQDTRALLTQQNPRRAELLEHGLVIAEELQPPSVPPEFAAAVIRAYRRDLISAERAVELLRRTVAETDLPLPYEIRMDELRADLGPLP
jgi:Zn-dependent peptidase ImmA (M78 family)/transcriptional regulator with XRE-family HTH domain